MAGVHFTWLQQLFQASSFLMDSQKTKIDIIKGRKYQIHCGFHSGSRESTKIAPDTCFTLVLNFTIDEDAETCISNEES